MAWRLDPFLVSFLDSVEQELAKALEMRHRRAAAHDEDESLAMRNQSDRIATLRSAIDALQAALERRDSPILH
jgi:hypothetical protein